MPRMWAFWFCFLFLKPFLVTNTIFLSSLQTKPGGASQDLPLLSPPMSAAAAFAFLATPLLTCIYQDVTLLLYPSPYTDLTTPPPYRRQREHRPVSDVLLHLVLFRWRMLGDGPLFQAWLSRANKHFLTWDLPFASQGLDPATSVLTFCEKWGVATDPWPWSKPPGSYETMNEWFCRSFEGKLAVGEADVVAPATAVVTWFSSAGEMPRVLKNDDFDIAEVGVPEHKKYRDWPAAIFYLAPSDYHCYHAPISGVVTSCSLLNQDKYSVTVKPYIFQTVNILRRNRRGIAVISNEQMSIALVIVGGVTVDSIRLEPWMKEVSRLVLIVCSFFRKGAESRGARTRDGANTHHVGGSSVERSEDWVLRSGWLEHSFAVLCRAQPRPTAQGGGQGRGF